MKLKITLRGIRECILTLVTYTLMISLILGTAYIIYSAKELLIRIERKINIYEIQNRMHLRDMKEIIAKGFIIVIDNDKRQLELVNIIVNNIDKLRQRVQQETNKIRTNIEELQEIQGEMQRQLEASQTIDLKEVKKIKRANLLLENTTKGVAGSGTHIKIDKKSYILTCAHLVGENTDVINGILDNGDKYALQLAKISKEKDLALFRIYRVANLPYLKISDIEPKEGSKVIAIGNPSAIKDVITDGIICHINDIGYMFTNVIYFGSSGGALLYKGKIVGVVSQFRILIQPPIIANYGYAIKLNVIKEFLLEE